MLLYVLLAKVLKHRISPTKAGLTGIDSLDRVLVWPYGIVLFEEHAVPLKPI